MTTLTSEQLRSPSGEILERRFRALADTDCSVVRATDATVQPRFVGHAAVFNKRTAIGNPFSWGFYEEIAPGAFTKTLEEGDARFLVDHDTSLIVARVSAGDLRLAEDEIGLPVDADLDTEVSYIRDFGRNVEKRRITGMSFGFNVIKDEWKTEIVETKDGDEIEVEVRTLLEVRLLEVSGVTFPAYEDTDAGLRSACAEIRSHRTSDPAQESDPEPGETTRDDATEPGKTTPLRLRLAAARMSGLAARQPTEMEQRP